MWSKRKASALLILAAATSASPAAGLDPGDPACTLEKVAVAPGIYDCYYDGQPPRGTVTAAVADGTVAFVWICDSKVTEFTADRFTHSRARNVAESCYLMADVAVGPATFTATAN